MRSLLKKSRGDPITEEDQDDKPGGGKDANKGEYIVAIEGSDGVARGDRSMSEEPGYICHSSGPTSRSRTSSNGTSPMATSSATTTSDHAPQPTETGDVVDRGLLSMDTATELVASYANDLVNFFPIVVLPQGTTAFELRQSKPILFLAIIAGAAL
jgi:hypothetical protein